MVVAVRNWLSKLQNRLTLYFGGLVLLISIALLVHIGQLASKILIEERGKELSVIATGLASNLGQTLYERMREVELLSQRSELMNSPLGSSKVKQQLALVKQNYPYYAWIGVTDSQGTVRADATDLLTNESVAQRPWFSAGLAGSYVGDAHRAVLLAKSLDNPDSAEPLRFVDFAAPIRSPSGELRGVVATHAQWSWVSDVIADFMPEGIDYQGAQALILNRNGQIIHPYSAIDAVSLPEDMPASNQFATLAWGSTQYLTSLVDVDSKLQDGLGWQVVIRQPKSIALRDVEQLQRSILIAGLVAVVFAVFMSHRLANRFSRPVERLAHTANRIGEGNEDEVIPSHNELAEIQLLSDSLRNMTDRLLARKRALQDNNRLLEQRVEERTKALAKANQELERLLRHDALTGLLNRRAFSEALHDEFNRMQRHNELFSIIMLDIDHFKEVNDQFGHHVGDEVLEHLAQVLRDAIRETDWVARFGGEEFVVLLPNTQEGAEVVAEKIRAAVEASNPPTIDGLTVSLGCATATLSDDDADVVLNRADKAMYSSKREGRNKVSSYQNAC